MITALLHRAYHDNIDLSIHGDLLKYRAPSGIMSAEWKLQLQENKPTIIDRLHQNIIAAKKGWTVFEFGEMYTKRLSERSQVFLFRDEDETFTVWRGSWNTEKSQPVGAITITEKTDFNMSLIRAENYFHYCSNRLMYQKK